MKLKHGIWCVYKGKEFALYVCFHNLEEIDIEAERTKKYEPLFYNKYYKYFIVEPGDVELKSCDKNDLHNGFVPCYDENDCFIGFRVVHKSDITKAYKYDTYALYHDIRCRVTGSIPKKDSYFLETYDEIYADDPLYPIFTELGFSMGRDIGYGKYTYCKYVSPDDPELQIFEERTEIDVNSL